MKKALAILMLAGASFALGPAITLKEQPKLILHADGTQEHFIGLELAVENPSTKDEIAAYSIGYSLPAGYRIAEADENFKERKWLENKGSLKGGTVPPRSRDTRYFRIVPAQDDLRIRQNATENELEVRIENNGKLPVNLKRLTPKGWTATSTNVGRIEQGEVDLKGERVLPGEERALKIAAPSRPAGYSLSLENGESIAERFSPDTVTTASLLSVEKQAAQNGTYLITISYRNPTEFTQKIRGLKLLRGEELVHDFSGTTAGPGSTTEFTTTDTAKEGFYWYSLRADTEHTFYADKGLAVIEAGPETRGPPTGFALLSIRNNGWLKNALDRIAALLSGRE